MAAQQAPVGPYNPATDQAPKKKGCFFYGCVISIILLIAFFVGGYALVHYGLHYAVEKFTTTTQVNIPSATATQSDYESVTKRLAEFKAAMDTGHGPETLTLTSNDINSLIDFAPKASMLRNHAVVDLRGDEAYAKFSLPLDKFNLPGRFVNGEGTFKASLQDGKLHLEPSSVAINGQSLPAQVLAQFSKNDSPVEMLGDPDVKVFFQKLKSIQISNGSFIVTRR